MYKSRLVLFSLLASIFISQNVSASELFDKDKQFIRNLSSMCDQNPDLAQKNVRYHAKGSDVSIINLFQTAELEKSPNAQIFIANAYYASHYSNDASKNFNDIESASELETHNLAGSSVHAVEFVLEKIYPEMDFLKKLEITNKIFRDAREKGSAYALYVSTDQSNSWRSSRQQSIDSTSLRRSEGKSDRFAHFP